MTKPSVNTHIRAALKEASIPFGSTLLLACSGGVDSQVLLDAFAHISTRDRNRVRLFAHGVNHGLRAEAEQELELARMLATRWNVPFSISQIKVEPGSNLQARARTQRYEALRAKAKQLNAFAIVTAHHQDDRAETVLIRLVRGAPLLGLAVMPIFSNGIFRPLIHVPRAEIEATASQRKLEFAVDPSNANLRYLRSQIRLQVLPLLRSMNPSIVEHLASLANEICTLGVEHKENEQLLKDLFATESNPTQKALQQLIKTENPQQRVWLRHGRVALFRAGQGIVIEENEQNWKQR